MLTLAVEEVPQTALASSNLSYRRMDKRKRRRKMPRLDDTSNESENALAAAVVAAGGDEPQTTEASRAKEEEEEDGDDDEEEESGGGTTPESATTTTTAFDHFNHPELFVRTTYHDSENDAETDAREAEYAALMYAYFLHDRNQQELKVLTLEQFFEKAPKEEGIAAMELYNFFESYSLSAQALGKAFADHKNWKEEKAGNLGLASADFGIKSYDLPHQYDLKLFEEQINDVFNWYNEDYRYRPRQNALHKKVGPYLCFIQSSGMGKTKLMYEYRMKSFQEDSEVASCLILPVDIRFPSRETDVFDFRPDFRWDLRYCTRIGQATQKVYSKLDEILKKTLETNLIRRKSNWANNRVNETVPAENLDALEECNKIVLMFDESQLLLEEQFEYDAFLFRCVRVWLREKRRVKKVVAVFAATNSSKVTDFLECYDDNLQPDIASSREVWDGREYHAKGGTNQLYPIFCHTTTMGSCLGLLAGETEYERAIYYGRPLFAMMAQKGILEEKIPNVLCRMLLVPDDEAVWQQDLNAVINILGTRVQLGKTSVEIVSNLVSKAFANNSGNPYQFPTLQLTYLADPVCARLAMCMMDENFRHRPIRGWKKTIKGKRKKWWTTKLKKIFSTQLVRRANGDVGEVVVALYMLFCGDLLRKKISNDPKNKNKLDYSQFSVSLDAWLDLLLSGGEAASEEAMLVDAEFEECPLVSVGFIQVCRNHVRSYANSWECLKDETFLKHIFESGIAFYVFEGCDLIDMVVPLRVSNKDVDGNSCPKCTFVPMLVSIKCQVSLDQQAAEAACHAMTTTAKESHLKNALCLLIVFGSKPSVPFEGDIAFDHLSPKVSQLLLMEDGVVGKAIRVPKDDAFGLRAALSEMTPDSEVNSELLSCHSFLMAHGGRSDATLTAENSLSAGASREPWKQRYNDLRKAMTSSVIQTEGKQEEESTSQEG